MSALQSFCCSRFESQFSVFAFLGNFEFASCKPDISKIQREPERDLAHVHFVQVSDEPEPTPNCVGVSALFGAISGAIKGIREANERGLKGWAYFGHIAGSVAIDAGSAAIGAVVGRRADRLMARILKDIKTSLKIGARFRTSADVAAGYFSGSYVSSRVSIARDYLLYDRKNK
jgi:hypothetical protein